jgi:hypothetical protein
LRLYNYYRYRNPMLKNKTYRHSQDSHATTSLLRHNTTEIKEYLIAIVQTNTSTDTPEKATCTAKIVISNLNLN